MITLVSQVILSSVARRGLPRKRDLAVNPEGENAHSHLGLGLVVIVILLRRKVPSEVLVYAMTFPQWAKFYRLVTNVCLNWNLN